MFCHKKRHFCGSDFQNSANDGLLVTVCIVSLDVHACISVADHFVCVQSQHCFIECFYAMCTQVYRCCQALVRGNEPLTATFVWLEHVWEIMCMYDIVLRHHCAQHELVQCPVVSW